MNKKKILITTGGTGGHLYVALAIGEYFSNDYTVYYAGTKDKMDAKIIAERGYPYLSLPATGFERGIKKKIASLRALLQSRKKIITFIKQEKIAAVISVGGYCGIAGVLAAKHCRIPAFLHEQNAIVGKANKFSSRYVTYSFTSFPNTKINKACFTGNPCGERAKKMLLTKVKLPTDQKIIAFVGGSLGAKHFNEVVYKMLKYPRNYHAIFITGQRYFSEYGALDNATILPYTDELPAMLSRCDLVVSRAGASIIAELLALKKPMILIPSPNVTNNHQYYNALAVKDYGAVIIDEEDLNDKVLEIAIAKALSDYQFLLAPYSYKSDGDSRQIIKERVSEVINGKVERENS